MSEPSGLTSEDRLRAATVGELRPLSRPIILCDYDPEWPRLFEREAHTIRGVLGDRALQVEHVGSTAVPGLAAKPTVDIVLVVADSADEDAYLPALESAGYVLRIREPESDEHRMFRLPDRSVHLHVLSRGCAEIDRMILFRDRLRVNSSDRKLYERTKRELARKDWKFGQHYADAKRPVIEEVLGRVSEAQP